MTVAAPFDHDKNEDSRCLWRGVADDILGGAAAGGRSLRLLPVLPVLPFGPVPRAGHRRGVDARPGRDVLPGGYVLAGGDVLASRDVLPGRDLLTRRYLLARGQVCPGRDVGAGRGGRLPVDGRWGPLLAGPFVPGPVVSPVAAVTRLTGGHPRQLQRGALVLRHDRRRVDGGRCVIP